MHRKTDQSSKRRIVLSGADAQGARKEPAVGSEERRVGCEQRDDTVRRCPRCSSELIQLVRWMRVGDRRWELTMECPNCWWSGDAVCGAHQVAELERRMEEGVVKMLRDLRRLANAIAAEELDRFVSALHADLILPEDF